MIAFVCWKWEVPGRARVFEAAHVNVLRAMVARHYPEPHRFICITDDGAGLDPRIEVVPCPVHFDGLGNPNGARFPSCYRRLWVFSREARQVLGPRIFCLDIDCVVLRELAPLVACPENFVGWCDPLFGWNKIAGGVYVLRTGTMPHVWEDFDPERSPALAYAHGNGGSDQGWMSYVMFPPPGRFPAGDLMKINWTPEHRTKPPPARIVFTSGLNPPWSADVQRRYPWVKDHWRQ